MKFDLVVYELVYLYVFGEVIYIDDIVEIVGMVYCVLGLSM